MIQLIFLLTFFTAGLLNAQTTGTVVFEIEGIRTDKSGNISAGLFLEPFFPKPGKQLIGTDVPITSTSMKIFFNNVPPGIYGAVAFQDIDRNKDLKTNFLGFPKEPIGFSNDARIKMGPPSFKDAAIKVEEGKTLIIRIILR